MQRRPARLVQTGRLGRNRVGNLHAGGAGWTAASDGPLVGVAFGATARPDTDVLIAVGAAAGAGWAFGAGAGLSIGGVSLVLSAEFA